MNIMVEVFGHGPDDVACHDLNGKVYGWASNEDCFNLDYAVYVSLFDH